MRFEDVETIRRSDFRRAVDRETYLPLMTGSMVLGNFSTPLEMTEKKRFEVCGLRFEFRTYPQGSAQLLPEEGA